MYTYGYLFYVPISLIFGCIFLVAGVRRKKPLPYYVCAVVALAYINMAVKMAMFPIFIEDIPEFDIYFNICWSMAGFVRAWKHDLLNMLLTLPIGLGIQFLVDTTRIKRVLLAVICGMSFELCQLLLLYTLKPLNVIFDIKDLVSNIAGVLVGLLLIQIINAIVKCTKETEGTSFPAYIDHVCRIS